MACVLPFQFCQRSKSLPYQIGSFSTLRNETTGRIGEKPRKTYLSLVTIIVSPPSSTSIRYLPAELDFYSVYIIYLTKVRLLSFVHLWWSAMETGTGRFDFTTLRNGACRSVSPAKSRVPWLFARSQRSAPTGLVSYLPVVDAINLRRGESDCSRMDLLKLMYVELL